MKTDPIIIALANGPEPLHGCGCGSNSPCTLCHEYDGTDPKRVRGGFELHYAECPYRQAVELVEPPWEKLSPECRETVDELLANTASRHTQTACSDCNWVKALKAARNALKHAYPVDTQ